jgi:hypothetical protein
VKEHELSILSGFIKACTFNGISSFDAKRGRPTSLVSQQNDVMANQLNFMAALGFAYIKSEVFQMAEDLGIATTLTRHR